MWKAKLKINGEWRDSFASNHKPTFFRMVAKALDEGYAIKARFENDW